jgi:hypothetical protein
LSGPCAAYHFRAVRKHAIGKYTNQHCLACANLACRCRSLITTSSQVHPNGGQWACSISIRQGFYFQAGGFASRNGQKIGTHFATRCGLEPMLRKAQLAVLNPRDDPSIFANVDLASASLPRQVVFSPNIVSLATQDPNLLELYPYEIQDSTPHFRTLPQGQR